MYRFSRLIPFWTPSVTDITERKRLEKVPENVYVDVYIKMSADIAKLSKQELKKRRIRRPVQKYNMISAEVPLSELQDLIEDPKVIRDPNEELGVKHEKIS